MPPVKPSFAVLDRGSILAQGLYAVWPFHEAGGTLAYDAGGRSFHGTLTNMASASSTSGWWKGPHGHCIALDGSNDYITIGGNSDFSFADTTFTAAASFQTSTAANQGIVGKKLGNEGWYIRVNTAGTLLARIIDNASSTAAERTTTTSTVNNGLRHTVVVVFKTDTVSTGSDVTIYLDGKLDQGSLTSGASYVVASNPLEIGRQGNGVQFFNGYIDIVAIWNRGLSAHEAELFNMNPYSMFVTPDVYRDWWVAPQVITFTPKRLLRGVG